MAHLDELLARISATAGKLAPLSSLAAAPALAPARPLQRLLLHLTTTKVHETYFPFVRFGAMHAARTATAWAGMTRARGDAPVAVLQDLAGFLTVAWGGGTAAALLTSSPPAWLVSPTPWLVYPAVYALLIPTGLAAYVVQTAPALPFNLAMAAVDGITRGVTLTAIPQLVAGSPAAAGGWWAAAVLAAIATNGGGWAAQTLGMNRVQWTTGRPGVLDGGLWTTLDVWGAMLSLVVYAALTRAYAPLAPLGDVLAAAVPDELRDAGLLAQATGQVVSAETARALAVLLLGGLFAVRALVLAVIGWRKEARHTAANKKGLAQTAPFISTSVVKSPAEPVASPKPKKRRARKSKTPAL